MAVAAQAWPGGGGAVAAFCSPHCAPAPASPTWHWEHVPRPEDGQRGQAPPQLSKVRLKDADLLAGGPRRLAPDLCPFHLLGHDALLGLVGPQPQGPQL